MGAQLVYTEKVGGSNPSLGTIKIVAGWSSQVARRSHKPQVVGSNPSPASTLKIVMYT